MLAKKRQSKINELLLANGAVTVSELATLFGVSDETVRRDLIAMERCGELFRVHGGAVKESVMKPYLELEERNQSYNEEKRELSVTAMRFIEEGDIISLDCGSTAIVFANVLKESFSNLTVITHSLDVFNVLKSKESFRIILCGGIYMPAENTFYGALTIDMITSLCAKKTFIFPSAVSLESGICDYQPDLFQIQCQLIKSAEQVYVLADSSKLEKKAFLKIENMKSDFTYITDSGISANLKQLYNENGINIYTK